MCDISYHTYHVLVTFPSFTSRCHCWLGNRGKSALMLPWIVRQACMDLEATEMDSLIGDCKVGQTHTLELLKRLLQNSQV